MATNHKQGLCAWSDICATACLRAYRTVAHHNATESREWARSLR